MPPDKTLDDYEAKNRFKRLMKNMKHNSMKKSSSVQPNGKVECPAPSCPEQGRMSRTAWGKGKKSVLSWINSHEGEYNADAVTKALNEDGYGFSIEVVKKNLNRFAEINKVKKIKKGKYSFYSNINDKLEQTKLNEKVQAEKITEDISELEQRLAETLRLEKIDLQKIQFHSIKIILNPINIKEIAVRDKLGGSGSGGNSPYSPEMMINTILDKAMGKDCIYQRWHTPHKENLKDISGGFQETIKVSKNTGFAGVVKIQIIHTGTVLITGDFSNNPIDLIRWREFERYLSGLLMGRCGYELLDMTDYATILFEMNVDKKLPTVKVGKAEGGFEITIKQFDEYFTRKYTKEIDGVKIMRDEMVSMKDVPYNQFLHEIMSATQGGLSSQVAIRNQYVFERAMDRVNHKLLENDKALEFLLKDSQHKSSIIQELNETNKAILNNLERKRERKVRVEQPQVKPETKVEAKPVVKESTTSNTKVCVHCGVKMWVGYMVCPACEKKQE